MSNIGLLQISYESLAAMLNLPKGHVITAIVPQDAGSICSQHFSILVSGPQLPEYSEGTFPPYVTLAMYRGKSHFG